MPTEFINTVLTPEAALEQLPVQAWHGRFNAALCDGATDALEDGKVLVLPLSFEVQEAERRFLDPASLGRHGKNISLDPRTGSLGNATLGGAEQMRLAAMMQRFADSAFTLVMDLLPRYAQHLVRARTSFRPAEIEGRSYSLRQDDRLLHVDAFPTRPLHGQRILRVFTNIAPDGTERKWHLGEPFATYAARFLPEVKRPWPGSAWALHMTGLTKGRRSLYDHIMLRLHDAGKQDTAYQANCPLIAADFPPGTTWMCFTDQVLHAALAGHCALEQTFHLPLEAMAHPEQTPLRVLERLAGRALT